jgi:hypothetical protein
MKRSRVVLVVFAALLALAGGATAAWAHGVSPRPPATAPIDSPLLDPAPSASAEPAPRAAPSPAGVEQALWAGPGAGITGALLVGLVLLFALSRVLPRRALAAGLVLVLAVFTVEGAVHSSHHLGDPQGEDCSVAMAAAHMSDADLAATALLPPRALEATDLAAADRPQSPAAPAGSVRDRSPPALLA